AWVRDRFLTGKVKMYVLARSHRPAKDSGRSEPPALENGKHLLVNAVTNRLQNFLRGYVSSRVDCDFNDHVASDTGRKFCGQHVRVGKSKRQRRPRSPGGYRSVYSVSICRP